MDELEQLIKEQKKDMKSCRVSMYTENETLIRPHLYRFKDFHGETNKEKAYSILRYLGWRYKDIMSALSLSVNQAAPMHREFSSLKNEENYKRFFLDIPEYSPKRKAVLIFRGLWWTYKEIMEITRFSAQHYFRISKQMPRATRRTMSGHSEHPRNARRSSERT